MGRLHKRRRGYSGRRPCKSAATVAATTFLLGSGSALALLTLPRTEARADAVALGDEHQQLLESVQQQQQEQEGQQSVELISREPQPPLDPEAALRFGYHVLRTHDGDRAKALSKFDTLTSGSGFPAGETLFLLGRAHDEGREDIGIKRDEVAARELYERAAQLGHPGSQHALSVLLASSAEGGGEVEAILYDYFASLGGDPLAHAALGYRFSHGLGTVQNCAQSLQHYLVAAREAIANLYSEGRGGIPRPVERTRLAERFVAGRRPTSDSDKEMVELWEAAAEVGDPGAIRSMGILYQHGVRGVEQDLEKAYKLFSKNVEKYDLHSTAYAGDLIMKGAGVPVDYEMAHKLFKRSKASPTSLNGLGYLYYHGLGVKEDLIQAFDYLQMALKADKDKTTPEISFNLGMLYLGEKLVDENGDDVQIAGSTENGEIVVLRRDTEKALLAFKEAAVLGHSGAAFRAALIYAESSPLTIGTCTTAVSHLKNVVERGPWMDAMRVGLRKAMAGDYGGALVLYSRLAEIGSEVAQSNAAWLLESGHCGGGSFNGTKVGCQKRALRLYEHAARQGRASAEMKVGDFHYYGKAGLDVDYEKAARRYLKAADANYAEALFNMGFMYQTGRGVPQDFHLAKRYFDDAALANTDAVPVTRISLFLLRQQQSWRRWRNWWRGARRGKRVFKNPFNDDDDGDDDDDDDDYFDDGQDEDVSLPGTETLALMGLVVLLVAVLVEQGRRQRARTRRPITA